VYPEGLFTLLTTSVIVLAYRWRDRPHLGVAAAIGVVIGLAALTRGEGLLLGPLLAMPWMLRHRPLTLARRWQHLVLAGLACVLVIAPWTARNLTSFNVAVPLSTNGNELFVYANCDTVYSGPNIGHWDFFCQERLRATLGEPAGDEAEKSVFWRRQGLDYAREHLGEVPKVAAARLGRVWDVFRPLQNIQLVSIEGRDQTAGRLGLGMYYGLIVASAVGVVSLRRRRVPVAPLLVQFAAVSLTALYAYGTTRFRAPVEPVLCVLAGVAGAATLPRLVERVQRRWRERPQTLHDGTAFVLGGRGGLLRGSDAWRTWLGIALVAVVSFAPVRGLYLMTGGTMEEGFMLAFPERILAGDLPNRDFLHLYGPGSLYLLAGWYWLFGVTLEVERTFGLLQHLGIIAAMFALGRVWGRAAATVIAMFTALFVLTQIGLSAMAWNGALALGLWSLVAALRARHVSDERSARRWWATAGALAGLSLTFRPDLGVAIVAAWVFLLWGTRWRDALSGRRSDAAWARASLGAVIGLTPLTVHVALVGPVRAVEGMFIDPVLRLRAGRALPRPPSWNRLDGAFQAIAEGVPPWWRLPHLPAPQAIFLWFFAMIGISLALVAVIMVLIRRHGRTPALVTLGAVAWFALGILPQGLQRPDSTHLAWVSCVSWPIAIVALMELGSRRLPRWDVRALLGVAIVAMTLLTLVLAPLFTFRHYLLYVRLGAGQVPAPFEIERNGRRFFFGDADAARASQAMIETLDALLVPGERLIVGPEDLRRTWYNETVYYYLFPELTPATYFMEMDPGLANADDSPLADELATADWVILTRLWEGWYEPNSSQDFGPDTPNQVIREQFCEVGSWEDGLVRLVRRCDATPVSADAASP
jgi:4-amino-4-deoxy-L-arabinose transferase-like glycosyltransferase